MRITFWGTRGSIASPGPKTVVYGGNTTCVEVTLSSGRTVIIDAGTGIRILGEDLLKRGHPLDMHLLMTHVHWDHLIGFPFFAPLYLDGCRIHVDGFTRGLEGLKWVFSNKHVDGTWPIRFDDLKARIEPAHRLAHGPVSLDGTTVSAHRIQHPQGGMGFKFTDDSGVFVFLTDNELREDGWRGTCFADFVRFCRNADLLVHDCQYVPEEMELRKGWGHSDLSFVARLAAESEVRRLVLFHHDPWRTDEGIGAMVTRCEGMLDQAHASIPVEAAKEGTDLTL
ncbi:MAG: MBL fold metallo-hydrolase [Deltaproteobacteria bacterium]|nr:MBL fold metallo-hydrolase [Deltaproteobacteria bacterium]